MVLLFILPQDISTVLHIRC